MKEIAIGIDVGKKGAIAFISKDKKEKGYFQIPLIKSKEIDITALSGIFNDLALDYDIGFVGIEDVHSVFGASAKANFQFGRCLGLLEGMTIAYTMPFSKVKPKDWQKEMWEGVTKILVSGKKKVDTKATSLVAAQRLFPGEKFLATARSSVPHDGIVDALLIAEYCRRKFL